MTPRDPPTIYDVAALAGVSIASVSRVVNDSGSIADGTRRRVQEAIEQLGYIPNGAAQGLGRGRSRVLGLVYRRRWPTASAESPAEDRETKICRNLDQESSQTMIFYDALIRHIESAAHVYGYSVLLSGVRQFDDHELVMRLSGRCDAMVLMESVLTEEHVRTLAAKIPVASMASRFAVPGVSNVCADNALGVRLLCEHLIDAHGKRRLAFVSGPEDNEDAATRLGAFNQVTRERGIQTLDQSQWKGDFGATRGFQVVSAWCRSGQELPDAIVCGNDTTAFGVLAGLREYRVDVPARIAVTGFDNIPLSRITVPALTTAHQPLETMSEAAVGAVMRALGGGRASQPDAVFATELVIRNSCGCTSHVSS